MKKVLTIIALALGIGLMIPSEVTAQTISNDEIEVTCSSYGRVRVYRPVAGVDTLMQIDRATVLFATDSTAVFDYYVDQDAEISPEEVTSPENSDYEITGLFNNGYTLDPPNVLVRYNLYVWSSGGYSIFKYTLINPDDTTQIGRVGLDIIPKIENSWGGEMATYDETTGLMSMFEHDTAYAGMKVLSPDVVSLDMFGWYGDYHEDSALYEHMTYDQIDVLYDDTELEPVMIISFAETSIPAGDSVEVYLGVSVGADSATMVANMALAESAYAGLLAIDAPRSEIPVGYRLAQNYPNPFNPNTTIEFSLSATENVLLSVYDLSGRLVTTLVDDRLLAGPRQVEFSGENLSTGVYFYTLKVGKFSTTRKMILLK
jgi:hypothetical protein